MNWEQKLEALNKLEHCSLVMRSPGKWEVRQSIEIKRGALMIGAFGTGATPEAAVEAHWQLLTVDLPAKDLVIARAGRPTRAAVRWNGFMWDHIDETFRPRQVRA